MTRSGNLREAVIDGMSVVLGSTDTSNDPFAQGFALTHPEPVTIDDDRARAQRVADERIAKLEASGWVPTPRPLSNVLSGAGVSALFRTYLPPRSRYATLFQRSWSPSWAIGFVERMLQRNARRRGRRELPMTLLLKQATQEPPAFRALLAVPEYDLDEALAMLGWTS